MITIQPAGQATFFGPPLAENYLHDASSTVTVSPANIRVFLASFPQGVSAKMLSYHCAVAAVGTFKIGVYSFIDGGKVAEFQVSSSRTGIVNVPCDLNLSPGLYWIAFTCTDFIQLTAFAVPELPYMLYDDTPTGKWPYFGAINTPAPGMLVDAIRLADFIPGGGIAAIPLLRIHGTGSQVYQDKYFVSVTSAGSYVDPPMFPLVSSLDVSVAVDGSLVVLGVGTRGNSQVISASLGGLALTKIRDDHPGVDCRTELWYIKNPPQGNAVITIALDTPTSVAAMAVCLQNVSDLITSSGGTGVATPALVNIGGGPSAFAIAVVAKRDYLDHLDLSDLSQGTHRGQEPAVAASPAGLWIGLSTAELATVSPKSVYYDILGGAPEWSASGASFRI